MSSVIRHLGALITIAAGSAFVCLYLAPYSLHRVVVVSYDRFDAAPNAEGITVFGRESLDFRLPFSTLLPCTIEEIHEAIRNETPGNEPPDSDLQLLRNCTGLVRARLNATDRGRPPAASSTAETLYREGTELHALCSEHAILLNEIVQSFGLLSRVL